eukprot:GHVU01063144.1.p1 GENE.GHVU01063144.1~~GHVU01063144.1.p1  ORF type:complete len:885 (-),score=122.23 GHVU01063144.1:525-3179(-)
MAGKQLSKLQLAEQTFAKIQALHAAGSEESVEGSSDLGERQDLPGTGSAPGVPLLDTSSEVGQSAPSSSPGSTANVESGVESGPMEVGNPEVTEKSTAGGSTGLFVVPDTSVAARVDSSTPMDTDDTEETGSEASSFRKPVRRGTHSGKSRRRSTPATKKRSGGGDDEKSEPEVTVTLPGELLQTNLRACPLRCAMDASCRGRSLAHFRTQHQALCTKFPCPGEGCTRMFPQDLKYADGKHLSKCFPDSGYPALEFWDLPGRITEGVLGYRGERMAVDTHLFLSMLMDKITQRSHWVLRMSVCAHLLEQLRMLELYGGSSTNIQEVYVPKVVFDGLDRIVSATRMRVKDVVGPATHEPLACYVRGPTSIPESARAIPEDERAKLMRGTGGDKPIRLAQLARRMCRRFQERNEKAETGMRDRKLAKVASTRAAAPAQKAAPKPALKVSSKRRKVEMNLGQAAVPFLKPGVKPKAAATVTSRTDQRSVSFKGSDPPVFGSLRLSAAASPDSAEEISRSLIGATLASASSDSESERFAGSARPVSATVQQEEVTGQEVSLIQDMTVSKAPTRKQLAQVLMMGANEVVRRARQMAELDTAGEEREAHLQLRAARAEREKDAVSQARDEALREMDRMTLDLRRVERERDEALQEVIREREMLHAAREEVKRERGMAEAARSELAEARRNPLRVSVPDAEVTAGQAAVASILETCLISRAAEALRRRATRKVLVAVAAREHVFRTVTSSNQQSCQCFQLSDQTCNVGGTLPEAADVPGIGAQVARVLNGFSVGQPVSLDSGSEGQFEASETADLELVQSALRNGMGNPADYRVLEDSLCVDARRTAVTRVATGWRVAQLLLTQRAAPAATPETEPVAGGSQDPPPPPAAQ